MLEICCVQKINCPYLSCDLIRRSTIICNFLPLDYIKAFLGSFRLSWLFLFSPKLFFPKQSWSLLKLKQWFLYISWVLCIFEKHLRTHFNHICLCWKLHKTSWLLPGKQCLLFFSISYLILFAVGLNSTELQLLVCTNPLVWVPSIFKQRIHNGMYFKISSFYAEVPRVK